MKRCIVAASLIGCIFTAKGQGACNDTFYYAQDPNNACTFNFFAADTYTPGLQHFWLFGDGSSASGTNPSHTYQQDGIYTVCHIVYIPPNVCVDSMCVPITVSGCGSLPPQCNISVNINVYPATQCNPPNCDGYAYAWVIGGTPPYTFLWNTQDTTAIISGLCPGTYEVTVTDVNQCIATALDTVPCGSGTNPSCNPAFSYSQDTTCTFTFYALHDSAGWEHWWSFGDMSWDTGITVSHTYINDGTYWVCHSVYVNGSFCNSSCMPIVVQGCGTGTCNLSLAYSVTPTSACDSATCDGSAEVIAWYGTPPYTFHWSNGDTSSIAHNLCWGIYSVTVTDAVGCSASTWVYVDCPPPCSAFSFSQDSNCTFTFFAWYDSVGWEHWWFFGDMSWDTGIIVSHTYINDGTYWVCHYVYVNGSPCDSSCMPVVVQGCGTGTCNLSLSYSTTPTSGCDSVTCDGSAEVIAWGGTPPYTFHWGNGNTSPIAHNLCWGTYPVTVTDAVGCSASTWVYVDCHSPCSDFSYSQDSTCTFTFYALYDSTGWLHQWWFGDGTIDTGAVVSHTYQSDGTYLVCHYAYNTNGIFCDSACVSIVVQVCLTGEVSLRDINANNYNVSTERSSITICRNDNAKYSVFVYGIKGELLFRRDNKQGCVRFDNVPHGMFIIEVVDNAGVKLWKRFVE